MAINGTQGEVQSKWFRINGGEKIRFHARFPTTSEWNDYNCSLYDGRQQAKPGEPATFDPRAMYTITQKMAAQVICGVESADPEVMAPEQVLSLGPVQDIVLDFVGWLFRDAAAFCDD